jgi:hypothetical protein
MAKRRLLIATTLLALLFVSPAFVREARTQSERTLVGEWLITTTPIGGEVISRRGNSLGFPDRHMTFEEQGDLRLGVVNRGELGPDVKPLGVWRIQGDQFSATFQLWCPEAQNVCGSIVMRGRFVDEHRLRGTATVFWDEEDPTRPTGFDTWSMSFRGSRLSAGGS